MSADNGIYIGCFPVEANKIEYRVTHAQAIDNCELKPEDKDLEDWFRVLYFKNAKVFDNMQDAKAEAFRIYDKIMTSDWPILEYGISTIEFDRPLLNMSIDEADKKITEYYKQFRSIEY